MNVFRQGLKLAVLSSALIMMGTSVAADKKIVVGGSLPLSGEFQRIGDMTNKGYQLAFKQLADSGDLKDYSVNLIIEDDQQTPTQTNNIWNTLIADNNAVAMLGPYGSTTSIVASNVAERYQVPHVLNSASSYKVHERNTKNLFNAYASLSVVRDPLIADFLESVGAKKVAAFGEDGEFGTEGTRRLDSYGKDKGYSLSSNELIKGGTPDLSPSLLKFKANEPDAFVGYFYINDWAKIVRQGREVDFNPKYFIVPPMGDAIDKKFIDAMGKDADYLVEVNVWLPTLESDQNKTFMDGFRAMFNEEPDYNAAAGYVAAQVLIDGLKNAEKPDDRASVTKALKDAKVDTLFGELTFDKDGRGLGSNLFLTQTIEGKPVVVFPENVAEKPVVETPKWKDR
ncbi:ABC transporter substrate-binding protein [Orrella sp. 11846]|uniref:ABC transporter substrate-binding protein n=1 Tax=Orrella sp. 11846 TaxID=3409913 RepID=UPI003B5B4541